MDVRCRCPHHFLLSGWLATRNRIQGEGVLFESPARGGAQGAVAKGKISPRGSCIFVRFSPSSGLKYKRLFTGAHNLSNQEECERPLRTQSRGQIRRNRTSSPEGLLSGVKRNSFSGAVTSVCSQNQTSAACHTQVCGILSKSQQLETTPHKTHVQREEVSESGSRIGSR